MVCLAVLTVLVGAALGGEEAHRQTIAGSFEHLAADLAASGHLDRLSARATLTPGARPVELGLPGVDWTEFVTRVEPGLYDVRLRAQDAQGTLLVELSTRVARAEGP